MVHISILRALKSPTAKKPVWLYLTQHFLNIFECPPLSLFYAIELILKNLTVLSYFFVCFLKVSHTFSCDFLLLWVLLLLEASLSLLFLLLNLL